MMNDVVWGNCLVTDPVDLDLELIPLQHGGLELQTQLDVL